MNRLDTAISNLKTALASAGVSFTPVPLVLVTEDADPKRITKYPACIVKVGATSGRQTCTTLVTLDVYVKNEAPDKLGYMRRNLELSIKRYIEQRPDRFGAAAWKYVNSVPRSGTNETGESVEAVAINYRLLHREAYG